MVKKTKPNNFDVVLAMAVIEHLVDPLSTLKNLRKVLKQNGKIIVTLPNVAHWSVRFSLLRGRFDYEEYGIMDRTHLHFYTIKTAKELLRESGYRITEIAFDSVGGGYPRFSRIMAKFFPNIFAYQILLVGQKN